MRNTPPEDQLAELVGAIFSDLQHTLASLPRPAALSEAEARLIAAREARASAWEIYRAAIARLGRSLSRDTASEGKVHSAKADLDKAEGEVVRAQRALARRRESHGKTIAAAIERHRVAAAAAIAASADILALAEAAAAREHVILPDLVEHSPAIESLVAAAHRGAMRIRNRADREFSRAGAELAARMTRAAPAPTDSIKWTLELSDFMGGIVDDVPVPDRRGSRSTTQKIPASIANGRAPASTGSFGIAAAANFLRGKRGA